jgi:hypothetical protein
VLSKLVASEVAASTVVASGGAASAEVATSAASVIFDPEAGGGVSSITCITVTILLFFRPTAFAAEGSSFFCKSFVSSGPSGLSSLIGKDSVITFKISSTSAAEGVEGAPSSISTIFCSGVTVFLFFEVVTFGSGLDFSFSKNFHLLLSS